MKFIVIIVSFCFCFVTYAQDKSITRSKWHNNDKIEKSDYKQIKKSKLFCSISNDKDYLIINLLVPDKSVSEMILEDGLTVWINMDGKQVRKLGVRYPIGTETPASKNQDTVKSAEELISLANTIELIGFISEQERRFAAKNSDNFRGYVKYSPDGDFYYRLVMPLAKLPVRNSKDRNGAMPFTLGLEIGYLPPAVIKSKSQNESHSGSALYWINDVKLASSQ